VLPDGGGRQAVQSDGGDARMRLICVVRRTLASLLSPHRACVCLPPVINRYVNARFCTVRTTTARFLSVADVVTLSYLSLISESG